MAPLAVTRVDSLPRHGLTFDSENIWEGGQLWKPRRSTSKSREERTPTLSLMAADAGAVRTDEEVISIGGTGRGADTAVVLNPVNTTDFFNLKVKGILCKPRL